MLKVITNHHKSGTVFWNRVLISINKLTKIDIFNLNNKNIISFEELLKKNHHDSLFIRDTHGLVEKYDLSGLNFLAVHSMRNAANLIFSGSQYHMKTTEEWANTVKKEFDNMSYKQKINSIESHEDKLIFEMTQQQNGIKRMFSLMSNPKFLSVDIDIISSDKTMKDLKVIYNHLKLCDNDIDINDWLNICKKHCFWNSIPKGKGLSHITTKQPGIYVDNRKYFFKKSREIFKDIFGEKSYKLTFEKDK